MGTLAFGASFIILIFNETNIVFSELDLKHSFHQILFQLRPSLIEEMGFRLGIVGLTWLLFGKKYALIAGSIPFGVLHLLNFLSGGEIYWLYIIGTTVAGLFLTMIFLNFNLGAAIVAHYSWNVLASISAKSFSFPQERLEGGYGTLSVLLVLSTCLYFHHQKRVNNKSHLIRSLE